MYCRVREELQMTTLLVLLAALPALWWLGGHLDDGDEP